MSRELTGKANHVFSKDEITSLDVHEVDPENQHDKPFVTVGDLSHSVLIHSIEQWNQLDALVRKAFDNLSE